MVPKSIHSIDVDPDFNAEVLAELYRYRHKSYRATFWIALLIGVVGGHRFYLGKTFSGAIMLTSLGAGFVWWIWDLIHLKEMVDAYNAQEEEREANGEPPQALAFLPQRDWQDMPETPAWAGQRNSRGHLIGSALLLLVLGFALGITSAATGVFEPVVTVLIFIAVTLVAARWDFMARVPGLRGLARWIHRLRLYYFAVDPGSVWRLMLRPIAGVFLAPWQKRARAEVRLYLQLGLVVTAFFVTADAAEFYGRGFWVGLGMFLAELGQTLAYTYAFVAPIGAMLTTQLLVLRRDRVLWLLSGLTVATIYLGIWLIP
ncbi:MAG: NINE protein [Pseudomonadales bacterium]|nr:NINE protein [Pseudomonadales bacterium]